MVSRWVLPLGERTWPRSGARVTICIRPAGKLFTSPEGGNRPALCGRSFSQVCRGWGCKGHPRRLSPGAQRKRRRRPAGQSALPKPRWACALWDPEERLRSREEATRGKFISKATPRNLEPVASSARALITPTSPSFLKNKTQQKFQTLAEDCAPPTRRSGPGPAVGSALSPLQTKLRREIFGGLGGGRELGKVWGDLPSPSLRAGLGG